MGKPITLLGLALLLGRAEAQPPAEAGLTATLFSLDASQWGAFAFGLFLAAIVYCTAYMVRLTKISVAGVDLTAKKNKVGRLVVPITALTTEALLVFSLTVYLSLLKMHQSPKPHKTETHYFDTYHFADEAAIMRAGVASVSITIDGYDGASHARILVNHQIVFESSFDCRLKYQCVAREESERLQAALAHAGYMPGCMQRECVNLDGTAVRVGFPVISFPAKQPPADGKYLFLSESCRNQITLDSAKGLRGCNDPDPGWSTALRRINWQGGIDTSPDTLPRTFDLKPFLRDGRNIIEIASENSGVGNCTLTATLAVTTANGKGYSGPPIKISGSESFMGARQDTEGGATKDEQRDTYASCGRYRIVLPISQASSS